MDDYTKRQIVKALATINMSLGKLTGEARNHCLDACWSLLQALGKGENNESQNLQSHEDGTTEAKGGVEQS